MANKIAVPFAGSGRQVETPNKCPLCHQRVTIVESLNANPGSDGVQILFLCPNVDCGNFFLAYYEVDYRNQLILKTLKPSNVEIEDFPLSVQKISPMFLSIYAEAAEAKGLGLDQIAGPGYRKAFEFLVKDYAKHKSPEDKHKEIEESFSGAVIEKFVSDARIQKVAKRALWLGNDETHYLRKWKDHDVEDLIVLIKLTVDWIEIEQLSDEYSAEIPG
ncbi:MAG: hypothetical protein WAO19_10790 [Candidatus Kryptoniota bacterium]